MIACFIDGVYWLLLALLFVRLTVEIVRTMRRRRARMRRRFEDDPKDKIGTERRRTI